MTQTALERCSVTWWRGYMRGRFQALAGEVVVAESAPLRGGADGPEDTAEARDALEELTMHLASAGWQPAEPVGDAWFARAFTRPSLVAVPEMNEIDAGLVQVLHEELRDALDSAERERRARIEAERHLHAVEQRSAPERAERKRAGYVAIALWSLAVVCAAAVSAVLTQSAYATAVVGLTAAAVALGVDSWRVSRS